MTDRMAILEKISIQSEDEARELEAARVKLSIRLGARPHLILQPVLYMTLDEIRECEEYLDEQPPNLAAVREVFDEARTRYPIAEAEAA